MSQGEAVSGPSSSVNYPDIRNALLGDVELPLPETQEGHTTPADLNRAFSNESGILSALYEIPDSPAVAEQGVAARLQFSGHPPIVSLQHQIASQNIALMRQVNKSGTISYTHNVNPQKKAELSEVLKSHGLDGPLADAATGFADPVHFKKTGTYSWVLQDGANAAQAIRSFLNLDEKATVIAECQTAAQAINYHTLLDIVGEKKFNAYFGGADPAKRLRIQMHMSKNPIEDFYKENTLNFNEAEMAMLDGAGAASNEAGADWISAVNQRPAEPGGFYFIANDDHYIKRHRDGVFMGENAFYYGRDEENGGQQVFGGLGMEAKTEYQLLQSMAREFNSAPTAGEIQAMYEKGQERTYPGIHLPVIGDPDSLTPDFITDQTAALIHGRHGDHAPGPDINSKVHAFFAEDSKTSKPMSELRAEDLAHPISRNQMNELARKHIGNRVSVGTQPMHKDAEWKISEQGIEMDRSKTRGKITLHSIASTFISTFGLHISALDSVIKLIRQVNADAPAALSGKPVSQATVNTSHEYRTCLRFPLPGDLMRAAKRNGGFQSLHAKVLDPAKIMKTFDLP